MKTRKAGDMRGIYFVAIIAMCGIFFSCGTNEIDPISAPIKSIDSVANIPWNSQLQYDSIVDVRDGNHYKVIKIGSQIWLAENLHYAGIDSSIGVCWGNKRDSCKKYGRLYTWTETMQLPDSLSEKRWSGDSINHQGICPFGWHVPNMTEWNSLLRIADPGDTLTGIALKSVAGWTSGPSTDRLGFRGLPGGMGYASGVFSETGYTGQWWSSTESNFLDAWYVDMYMYHDYVYRKKYNKTLLQSTRCIKD